MPRQTLNGIQLYYHTQGKGPPLLFLSGFGSHHQGWSAFVEAFAPYYQTITMDNRGAGQSSAPPTPYTIDTLAHDVIALLDHLSLARSDLIASSMGAAVALTLALLYPDRVRKAVLISPFAKLPLAALCKLRAIGNLLKANVPFDLVVETALPWLFSNQFLSHHHLIKAKKEDFLRNPYPQSLQGFFGQLNALASFDLRSQLSSIKTPMLLIAGEQDRSTPLACAQFLKKHLLHSELASFPRAAHMVHAEHRAAVIERAYTFLRLNRRHGMSTTSSA